MNKKIRSPRSKSVHDLARAEQPVRMRQLQRHSQDLSQEIQRLECTIAAAPHAMRQRRLATVNTLPALQNASRRALPTSGRRMPLQQRRAVKRQRWGLIIELALVMTALAAAVGWMKQWI